MPPICRTHTCISFFQDPRLDCLQMFVYLFTSMWPKRLMKQQGAWYLWGNNYMEIAFTGHCVAPQQPVLNWQKWSDLQLREQIVLTDLLFFFFFLSSHASHRPSSALSTVRLPYCTSNSERPHFTPTPQRESVNLNREMSFSDLLGFMVLWLHRRVDFFFICFALAQTFLSAKRLGLNCRQTSESAEKQYFWE